MSMNILDNWLLEFSLEPLIEESIIKNGYLNVSSLNKKYQEVLDPFLKGKTCITKYELDYINSELGDLSKISTFRKIYKELFENERLKITPIISLWNDIKALQYIVIASNGNLLLSAIEIPLDIIKDRLKAELLLKNIIPNISNIKNLPIKVNYWNNIEPVINILDESNFSDKNKIFINNSSMVIGKYIISDNSIVVLIKDKLQYWDINTPNKIIDLNNVRSVCGLVTNSQIINAQKINRNLLFLKEEHLKNLEEE